MNQPFKRTDRISGLIQRKLAVLIPQEIRDPKVTGLITITAVKVDADLARAKVYFTILQGDSESALAALNAAAPYLRSLLARSMTVRSVPQLVFFYDESIEYGQKLSRLIDEANKPDSDDE